MKPTILAALVVSLIHCAYPEAARALVWHGPDNLLVSVQGSCPGEITVVWTGATAHERAGLWFSRNLGEVTLPAGPCGGTVLGLGTSGLRLARVFNTGPNGEGVVGGRVVQVACGGYLQMMVEDAQPCTTSNVVQIP